MPYTIILHLQNEEPVIAEMDEIPSPSDRLVLVNNPRRLDGKDLHYLQQDVDTVLWPITRINFIEVISDEGAEQIIGFVRE